MKGLRLGVLVSMFALGWGTASARPAPPAAPKPAEPAPAAPTEDPSAQVEKLAAEAHAAYRDGRFDIAVARYLEAYKLTPTARLLYNIAFIYDTKLKELDLAIEYYKRFVKAPDAEPEIVERTLTRLSQLRDMQEHPPDPPPDSNKLAAEAPSTIDLGPPGWALLVAGLGVGAAGAVCAGIAFADQQAFASSGDPAERDRLKREGEGLAVAADVLMFTGAAALVAGVILLALPSPEPPKVSPSAFFLDGGVVVTIGGAL